MPTPRWARSWCAGRAVSSARAGTATRWRPPGRDPAAPETYAGLGDVYRSFARVGELEPPTIAAVRGGAVGAGVNLAFATDLRVVAREATIVSGFLPIGLHPGGGHGVLLGRTGQREAAAAMALFGERIDGERAAALGLAWSAVDDNEVEGMAHALAGRAAADPELARRTARSLRTELGRLRCRGPPRWSSSARRRCGRCGASTWPATDPPAAGAPSTLSRWPRPARGVLRPPLRRAPGRGHRARRGGHRRAGAQRRCALCGPPARVGRRAARSAVRVAVHLRGAQPPGAVADPRGGHRAGCSAPRSAPRWRSPAYCWPARCSSAWPATARAGTCGRGCTPACRARRAARAPRLPHHLLQPDRPGVCPGAR